MEAAGNGIAACKNKSLLPASAASDLETVQSVSISGEGSLYTQAVAHMHSAFAVKHTFIHLSNICSIYNYQSGDEIYMHTFKIYSDAPIKNYK